VSAERGGASRGVFLVLAAIVVSSALVGAYLAAGGSSYTPAKTKDPCKHRPWRNPQGIDQIAEQFSLSALDGAACRLGVSREELAQALTSTQARDRFTERYGISEDQLARAVRAGLLRAVNDAEEAGALSPVFAGPLRATLRDIPLDQAIALIQNARALLDNVESFLGPAQELLEQFLP
jgi:hypothetical protein